MPVHYRRRAERGPLAALRRLLTELRYPTTRRGKIIATTLAALVFSLLSLALIGGFLLSRVLTPPQAAEAIDPTLLITTTQAVQFQTPDGTPHNGWFFPGLRRGPVVVLCHGYKASRAEILTLGSSLQEHRYNVFAFNLAGHAESPYGRTTLGYREAEEVEAALHMLARRPDIDASRIGLWGQSLGAYTALLAAQRFDGVKAVVLDSVYVRPQELLERELGQSGASWLPLLKQITRLEFGLYTFAYRNQNAEAGLERLAGKAKLFIAAADQPELTRATRQLYARVPEPKQYVLLPRTNLSAMVRDERRDYERRVVTFFLTHLSLLPPR